MHIGFDHGNSKQQRGSGDSNNNEFHANNVAIVTILAFKTDAKIGEQNADCVQRTSEWAFELSLSLFLSISHTLTISIVICAADLIVD